MFVYVTFCLFVRFDLLFCFGFTLCMFILLSFIATLALLLLFILIIIAGCCCLLLVAIVVCVSVCLLVVLHLGLDGDVDYCCEVGLDVWVVQLLCVFVVIFDCGRFLYLWFTLVWLLDDYLFRCLCLGCVIILCCLIVLIASYSIQCCCLFVFTICYVAFWYFLLFVYGCIDYLWLVSSIDLICLDLCLFGC